jgi:peptidoglycan/xylan/chitin deacetylase (PgdA/CDA1 family)
MLGAITCKRGIKRTAGWASVVLCPFAPPARDAVCILMYHRITRIGFVDQRADDWNVPPDIFEWHMRTLSAHATVVPLHTLRDQLAERRLLHRQLAAERIALRPLACVTLDDGYASACEHALPVLVRYHIPATFFVPTAYIDKHEPMPFDRWGHLNRGRVAPETWRPIGWRNLEQAAKTGLVTIGSHSHAHLAARDCSPDRLREEAERSRDQLHKHLGPDHARTYAYPYGNSRLRDVPPAYETAVRAAGYELAVTTDPGLATAASNPFRLPRLEVHQLDSAFVLRAKLRGSLAPYHAIDRLRPAP